MLNLLRSKLGQPSIFLWLIVPFFIAQAIVYTSSASNTYFKERYEGTGNTSWGNPHVREVWLFSIAVCSMLTLDFLLDVYNRNSHRLQYLGKIETILRLIFIFQVGLSALCLYLFADMPQLMARSQLFHQSSLVPLLTSYALTKTVGPLSNAYVLAFYWLSFYFTLAVIAVGNIYVPYTRFTAPTYDVNASVFSQIQQPRIMLFFVSSVYTTVWVIAVYLYKVYTLTLRALQLRRRFFIDDMEVLVLVCGALQFTTNFLKNGIHASEASPLICNFSPMMCNYATQTVVDLQLYYGMWCAWAVLFAVVPKQMNVYRTRTANAEIVGAKQALERLLEEYATEGDSGEGLIGGGVQEGSVTKLQDVVASCGRAIAMLQRVADVDAETASVSTASPPLPRRLRQQLHSSSSWREQLSSISNVSTMDNQRRHRVHTAADDTSAVEATSPTSPQLAASPRRHASTMPTKLLQAASAASRASRGDVSLSVGESASSSVNPPALATSVGESASSSAGASQTLSESSSVGASQPLSESSSVGASEPLSESSSVGASQPLSASVDATVSSLSDETSQSLSLWRVELYGSRDVLGPSVAARGRRVPCAAPQPLVQVGADNGGAVDPVGRMLLAQEAV